MKLLLISPGHVRGGVEDYALKIAGEAVERGWETHAAFADLPELSSLVEDFRIIGSSYHSLDIQDHGDKRQTIFAHLGRFVRSLRLLRTINPDRVQINLPWVKKGFATIIACAWEGVPTQVVFHLAPRVISIPWWMGWLGRWAKDRRQDWIAVSNYNQKIVSAIYDIAPESIKVVHNGISPLEGHGPTAEKQKIRAQVRKQLGLTEGMTMILSVGRLSHQKGCDELVAAAKFVCRHSPGARFVWAGDGDLRASMECAIADGNLNEMFQLLGFRKDVQRLLCAADLFILPSRHEGFPFALLEAMAYEVPIVATNVCGNSELIIDRVHGLLCCSGSSAKMAATIIEALEAPDKMQDMAKRALGRSMEFTEEKMLQTALDRLEALRPRNCINSMAQRKI